MAENTLNHAAMERIRQAPYPKAFANGFESLAAMADAAGGETAETALGYIEDESTVPKTEWVPELVLRVRRSRP